MEDIGVGRPSTYASIVSTILDRGYVWKKGSAMVPSLTAFGVVGLLEQHFADLVDYGLTASMEDDLDEIAGGDQDMARGWATSTSGPAGPGAPRPAGTEPRCHRRRRRQRRAPRDGRRRPGDRGPLRQVRPAP